MEEQKQFTATEIVEKILGKLGAVGESNADGRFYDRMPEYENLIRNLVNEYIELVKQDGAYEASVKSIVNRAKSFLEELSEDITGCLET